jgi:hypothetical protein
MVPGRLPNAQTPMCRSLRLAQKLRTISQSERVRRLVTRRSASPVSVAMSAVAVVTLIGRPAQRTARCQTVWEMSMSSSALVVYGRLSLRFPLLSTLRGHWPKWRKVTGTDNRYYTAQEKSPPGPTFPSKCALALAAHLSRPRRTFPRFDSGKVRVRSASPVSAHACSRRQSAPRLRTLASRLPAGLRKPSVSMHL